jgi:hypothetical protein
MINHKIKFIIIIPENPPFELPGVKTANLKEQLTKTLKLGDTGDYTKLYTKGKIDDKKVFKLFERRGGLQPAPRRAFPDLADPKGLINEIRSSLRIRRDVRKDKFKLRPEHPARTPHTAPLAAIAATIDGQPPPPKAIKVTNATIKFLTGESGLVGNTILQSKPHKNTVLTDDWLDKGLPRNLRKLIEIAVPGPNGKGKGIIFHEPHHDLSPGMLLLDEIFTALTSKVADLVEVINAKTERTNRRTTDLSHLIDFVNKLRGVGGKNEFTSFILPGGQEHTFNGENIPIDPTRVELLVAGGWIYAAQVFVGAWQGGTHSNGSVHT